MDVIKTIVAISLELKLVAEKVISFIGLQDNITMLFKQMHI